MSLALASRRAALLAPWNKNELWRRAKAVPSLDLRFADNKSLVDATTGQNLVTFTRASGGTFVGSDGLLKTATTNFALNTIWSGGTTPTSWALTGTPDTPTVISSTLGSADGATALSFTSSASRNYLIQTVALAANTTYVFSVYVEAISGYASGSNNVVSLNNGPAGSTITGAVGNPVVGQRIFCSIANGATAGNVQLRVGLGVGSNATGTVILSRPQLEQSSTVGEYIPTTSTINSAPRFDHNPVTGESLGLLVEEQRSNLLLNSGTLATQNVTVTAVAHTLSFTGTGTITLSGTSTAGPLVGTGTGEANRVSLTFTPTAGTLTLTVSGTVTNAQLEIGAFRTSYIPTTASAATRAADVCSISGSNFSSWYRQDEGTVFVSASVPQPSNGNRRVAFATDGTGNNRVGVLYNSSNNPQFLLSAGGTIMASISSSVTASGLIQSAAGYALDDFAFAASGLLAGTDTSGAVPSTVDRLSIGSSDGVDRIFGHIRRLTYWPTRLPNSTLQSITQ